MVSISFHQLVVYAIKCANMIAFLFPQFVYVINSWKPTDFEKRTDHQKGKSSHLKKFVRRTILK